jgi:uncharacterized membrane protein YccC
MIRKTTSRRFSPTRILYRRMLQHLAHRIERQEPSDRSMSKRKQRKIFSPWDFVHAVSMAFACLATYWIMTQGLGSWVDQHTDYLGGMWAAIAAVFVWRETPLDALSAGLERLIATGVSFILCLPYLLFFPSTPIGMAVLLYAGTIIMMLLGRRDDIIMTAITTIVVTVVAMIDPLDAWHQPVLRLIDTMVGIGVGVACKWLSSLPAKGHQKSRNAGAAGGS